MIMRRHQEWIARLAMIAVIFAALAPTLSYAFGANAARVDFRADSDVVAVKKMPKSEVAQTINQVILQTICSVSGNNGTFDPAHSGNHDAGLHLAHCPYCVVHAGSFGVLASPSLQVFLLALNHVKHFDIYTSPLLPDVLSVSYPSQAPPLV